MRRGLNVWNPEEITQLALDQRLSRLRAAMSHAGLDAIILYTNFVRPAAVAYMSSFSPYWADGLLFIPRSAEPVFSTSMSTRMNTWIKTVNPVGTVINTRRPGAHVGEWLKANPDVKALGVVEVDGLPAGIYNDLVVTAPHVELIEAAELFANFRAQVDATEHALLRTANWLAHDGLDAVDPDTMKDAGTIVGRVEQVARLGGAEEAYIAIAPDVNANRHLARLSGAIPVGESFAVRASVAYKGAWVRRTRTFSSDAATATRIAELDGWFASLLAGLDTTKPFAGQIEEAAQRQGFSVSNLLIESCTGTYPLQPLPDQQRPPRQGSLYVVTLSLRVDGINWLGALPVIVGMVL